MIDTITTKQGGQMTMSKNANSFPTNTLAMSTAAIQRLNYKVKTLDPYARNTFFQTKLRLSEILCRQGFCTWREIQHRETGESLCKMYFRLGNQSFSWSVPTRTLHFDVSFKDPPTAYEGTPADEAKVAMMSDHELMVAVVNIGCPPPSLPEPKPAPVQNSNEQQLAWIKEFHDKNGRWPSRNEEYPPDNAIGQQVLRWRNCYKNGSLDWHVVKSLNEMGFHWDAHSNDWFERFFKTYEFLKANMRWPSFAGETSVEEKDLAQWLFGQASNYRSGLLDPKKKWLLDRLNFDWGGYSRNQSRYKTNG